MIYNISNFPFYEFFQKQSSYRKYSIGRVHVSILVTCACTVPISEVLFLLPLK